eukprot:12934485-Prorocentrum_lima.AAC.1
MKHANFQEQSQLKQASYSHAPSVVKAHASRQEHDLPVVYNKMLNDANQQHAANEERPMQKLISQEQEVRGLEQVEQNLVETIQDFENRVGLDPIP